MEITDITLDIPDEEVTKAIVEWADEELDDRFSTYLGDNGFANAESEIRELLSDFTPGGGGCRTARMFEDAVNSILDNRGEIVLQPASDAIAHLVTEEVKRQLGRAVYQMSQMYTPLHGGAA